jgi:hypothetical protein
MTQSNEILLNCQHLIDEVNLKQNHEDELTHLKNCQTTDRIDKAQQSICDLNMKMARMLNGFNVKVIELKDDIESQYNFAAKENKYFSIRLPNNSNS